MAKPTFSFLGLGKRRTEKEETDEERRNREAAERRKNKKAAEEDEEEEDEDEEEEGAEEDEREARRSRNALRAAGHRRGVAAERSRLAVIFNDLDPDKLEMAVPLALHDKTATLPAEQVRAMIDATPARREAAGTQFEKVMGHISTTMRGPSFESDAGGARTPTLPGQMAKLLKLPEPKR